MTHEASKFEKNRKSIHPSVHVLFGLQNFISAAMGQAQGLKQKQAKFPPKADDSIWFQLIESRNNFTYTNSKGQDEKSAGTVSLKLGPRTMVNALYSWNGIADVIVDRSIVNMRDESPCLELAEDQHNKHSIHVVYYIFYSIVPSYLFLSLDLACLAKLFKSVFVPNKKPFCFNNTPNYQKIPSYIL